MLRLHTTDSHRNNLFYYCIANTAHNEHNKLVFDIYFRVTRRGSHKGLILQVGALVVLFLNVPLKSRVAKLLRSIVQK